MIGGFISLISIFLFESESYSVSFLAKSTLAFNIIRSLAALIGSINSLQSGGTEEFEYPATSLLNSFTLLFLMFSVERGIEKLENFEEQPKMSILNRFTNKLIIFFKERFFKFKNFFIRRSERKIEEGIQMILLQNLEGESIQSAIEIQSSIVEDENEARARGEQRTKNLQTLKRIYSLRYLC